jgi:hypothetical protein
MIGTTEQEYIFAVAVPESITKIKKGDCYSVVPFISQLSNIEFSIMRKLKKA